MMALLILVPLVPLAAAGVVAASGRWLRANSGWVVAGSLAVSAGAVLPLRGSGAEAVAEWFAVGELSLTLSLRVDGLSWWMAVLVVWVALAVQVYAVGYGRSETRPVRFHAWLSLFAAAMLTLVLAGSLLLLFIAWELVGLASFALIGHRHREARSRYVASQALVMTRLGDVGLLLTWLGVFGLVGTTEIPALEAAVARGTIGGTALTLLTLGMLVAAVGKSAQLPLTAWLPDAMVGPTPVSALIHSATMVAAGVYLLLRLFPLLEGALLVRDAVLWVGAVTAVFAAVAASAQIDLKRVLAWSTVSQLGEMFVALGLAGPIAAAFHLTTHAVFKSGLFLAAGAVEHGTGTRDLARLGGLWRSMPWTAGVFAACGLALAGFPLLAGYWSEERILTVAAQRHWGWAVWGLVVIALAGVYIARAGVAVFAPRPGGPALEGRRSGWVMGVPMLVLAVAAVGLGRALHRPAEQVLPFEPAAGTLGWGWRAGAIVASLLGLSAGAWFVWARGAAPAFGGVGHRLASSAAAVPAGGRWIAAFLAIALSRAERILDAAARGGRSVATAAARLVRGVEADGFDRGARILARWTVALAAGSGRVEDHGFWRANDRLAAVSQAAGQRLRRLESGRLYLYTLGLFTTLLIGGGAIALLWLAIWLRGPG